MSLWLGTACYARPTRIASHGAIKFNTVPEINSCLKMGLRHNKAWHTRDLHNKSPMTRLKETA